MEVPSDTAGISALSRLQAVNAQVGQFGERPNSALGGYRETAGVGQSSRKFGLLGLSGKCCVFERERLGLAIRRAGRPDYRAVHAIAGIVLHTRLGGETITGRPGTNTCDRCFPSGFQPKRKYSLGRRRQ